MAENQTRRQRKLCTPAPLPEGLGADGQRTLIPLIMSEASGCEGREKHLAVSSTSLSRERWAGTGGLGGGGRKEFRVQNGSATGDTPCTPGDPAGASSEESSQTFNMRYVRRQPMRHSYSAKATSSSRIDASCNEGFFRKL